MLSERVFKGFEYIIREDDCNQRKIEECLLEFTQYINEKECMEKIDLFL